MVSGGGISRDVRKGGGLTCFCSSGNFFKNGTTESGSCRGGVGVDNGDEVMGK